ncbi:E3 ubiquitin ligase RIE1-like [Olea europaea subsp. europaea]|uniref:RING-type E3 ubiquitin transferase n=1 Tax=Olea europaea subsp. europaea TaxID=158383 RepID=A0A8S0VBV6_OLEEU|nr:E3 ubiquitin ligase RIE1-like [Olea europaea subsp. europaea]
MQEGKLEVNLSILPKYRFETFKDEGKLGVGAGRMVPIRYTAKKLILQRGDSECCICLCRYEDAVAIQAIRCTHHFHTSCIVKWPKVEALCPVCKYDIHKGKDHE